jgi:hypothetical protein
VGETQQGAAGKLARKNTREVSTSVVVPRSSRAQRASVCHIPESPHKVGADPAKRLACQVHRDHKVAQIAACEHDVGSLNRNDGDQVKMRVNVSNVMQACLRHSLWVSIGDVTLWCAGEHEHKCHLDGYVGPGPNRDTDVGLRECRRVVDAVADHGHHAPLVLKLCYLGVRECVGGGGCV